jgi:hypothetical protein
MDKRDEIIRALAEALGDVLPPMPPADALCHIGICPQERCCNCQRIAAGYAALKMAEQESA